MANTETFDFQKFHKDTECFEQDSKCLEGPVPTTLRQAASPLTTNLGLDNFGMTNNNRGTPSYHPLNHPLIGFSITINHPAIKGYPHDFVNHHIKAKNHAALASCNSAQNFNVLPCQGDGCDVFRSDLSEKRVAKTWQKPSS